MLALTDFSYQELARHGLPIFRTVMVERVAYKEMFLTGKPPSATDTVGAGGEIGALVTEIDAIVAEGKAPKQTAAAAGQGA